MKFPNEQELEALREKYPAGTRIRLIAMTDDPHPSPAGTIGTVVFVDDAGNVHTNLHNGRSLALIEGVDEFRVLNGGTHPESV